MDALESSYDAKLATYNALVAGGDPAKLPEIQTLNGELAGLLHSMLEELSKIKSKGANLLNYRDQLLIQLVGFQNDATIMRQQRDQYATLRMLQTTDQTAFNTSFFWYSIALGIAVLMFVSVLIFRGHSTPAMPTMTSNPTTMADFT